MGLFKKLFGGEPDKFPSVGDRIAGYSPQSAPQHPSERPSSINEEVEATLLGGHVDLEVVGESHYQPNLRAAHNQFGRDVYAVLVPEPDNPWDPNAVGVFVGGLKVGHLSRDDAAAFQGPVLRVMREEGTPVALRGRIVGGDAGKSFGIWLKHDPEDFGFRRPRPSGGETRTGATLAGDVLDWADRLPFDPAKRIPKVRKLLESEADPVSRHYMFDTLEEDLYKLRNLSGSMLDEYDKVCEQHHAELVESIRAALIATSGGVPWLETYRQSAIRWQKAHDFERALRWAERGLEMYGDKAIRPEAVEDLQQRAEKYQSKLDG